MAGVTTPLRREHVLRREDCARSLVARRLSPPQPSVILITSPACAHTYRSSPRCRLSRSPRPRQRPRGRSAWGSAVDPSATSREPVLPALALASRPFPAALLLCCCNLALPLSSLALAKQDYRGDTGVAVALARSCANSSLGSRDVSRPREARLMCAIGAELTSQTRAALPTRRLGFLLSLSLSLSLSLAISPRLLAHKHAM